MKLFLSLLSISICTISCKQEEYGSCPSPRNERKIMFKAVETRLYSSRVGSCCNVIHVQLNTTQPPILRFIIFIIVAVKSLVRSFH